MFSVTPQKVSGANELFRSSLLLLMAAQVAAATEPQDISHHFHVWPQMCQKTIMNTCLLTVYLMSESATKPCWKVQDYDKGFANFLILLHFNDGRK